MTVKELKQKLSGLPDNMDVFVNQTNTSFEVSLLEKAEVENVSFQDGDLIAKDKCLVLTDEI